MRDRTAILIIFGTSLLFFSEPLFTEKTFVYRDIHLLIYPMKQFAKSCISSGFLPFWNPYILCGAPFLAQIHHQTLYPLSLIVYLLPFPLCMDIFVVVHIFLSGLFFYYLMKDQGLNSLSSLFSAITYAFCGVNLSTGNFIITLSTATWTPLILLFYLRALRRCSMRYSVLSGIISAISLLSGTPGYLYLDILLILALTAAFVIHRKSLFPIKLFLITILSAIGISLFQILPFLQFVLLSNRAEGILFSKAIEHSLSLYDIFGIFIPAVNGLPFDNYCIIPYVGQRLMTSLYIGIFPLILALSVPFWTKRRAVLFWATILTLSIGLSMGKYLGLYWLFYKLLPGFSMLRYPAKAMHLFSLSASILAGFGFSQILNRNLSKIILFFLSFYISLFLLFRYTDVLFYASRVLYTPYRIDMSEFVLWISFVSDNCLKVALILTGFLALFWAKRRVSSGLFYSALISLTIFDLHTANSKLSQLVDEDFYKEKPRFAEFIENRYSRYFSFSRWPPREFVVGKEWGNMGMVFGLFNVRGIESFWLKDLNQLVETVSWRNLFYLAGVKHLFRIENRSIFHTPNISLPRIFFVLRYRMIKERDRILDIMNSPDFCPKDEIILEEEPRKTQNSKLKTQSSKCEIVEYLPNRVVIRASCPSDGFLFLSDTYYPEWRCYVDGKRTKIYRANYCFRAVELKKGEHRVEFLYFPKRFIIGLIGSVISGIIVGLAIRFVK